jgi:pilus assembly protein TadC
MLSHIAEWAVAVLAGGVIAGLVVIAAGAAGVWLLYRRVRRRLEGAPAMVARFARHNAVGAGAGMRVRLPPRVVHDLRRRINGPPEVW